MFLTQHAGVVNRTIPKMSTGGGNERTPEEWLHSILYSGQVTRVGQHLALVLFHVANEKGIACLSMRDLQAITGWGRTTICDHLGEIETFIKTTMGRGRGKSTFELQGLITQAIEQVRSVRQPDTNGISGQSSVRVADSIPDTKADTNEVSAQATATPDAIPDTTIIVRETDTTADTNPIGVRQPDTKPEMGGTIGGVTNNKPFTVDLSQVKSTPSGMQWAYNSLDGFMGRVFEILPEHYAIMQATYAYLDFPADLASADGFLASEFDKSKAPANQADRLTRLEMFLASQNRKAKALQAAHDKAAAGKGSTDKSCFFRDHELVVANGFRDGLLQKVGGDQAKLDETLMKAAGKIPITLKGIELKKLVSSEFMKHLDWDRNDKAKGSKSKEEKEFIGSRWKRKLSAKDEGKSQ